MNNFNTAGCWALFVKEVKRFYSVSVQTIFAPVVSTLLYLLVFGQVIDTQIEVFSGLEYSQFLIPGLVMIGDFAECVCQYLFEFNPIQNARQFDLRLT